MADYPLPKFHFRVEWGGTNIGFTEVTGLNVETEVIEYRHGNSPEYNKTKQPGLQKYGDITAKRGTFENDNEGYTEWDKTKLFEEKGAKFRRDVTISLLNENHAPTAVWKLKKAWIKKVTYADLKADANEIAIETLEFTHEGISVSIPA